MYLNRIEKPQDCFVCQRERQHDWSGQVDYGCDQLGSAVAERKSAVCFSLCNLPRPPPDDQRRSVVEVVQRIRDERGASCVDANRNFDDCENDVYRDREAERYAAKWW